MNHVFLRDISHFFAINFALSPVLCMNIVYFFQVISFDKCELKIHVFKLYEEGPANEEIEDDDISAASHWVLPAGEI